MAQDTQSLEKELIAANTELQAKMWQLAARLTDEAVQKQLTRQIIISVQAGKINDVRENNIVTGTTVVDYYLQ